MAWSPARTSKSARPVTLPEKDEAGQRPVLGSQAGSWRPLPPRLTCGVPSLWLLYFFINFSESLTKWEIFLQQAIQWSITNREWKKSRGYEPLKPTDDGEKVTSRKRHTLWLEGKNTDYWNSGPLRTANNSFKTSLVQWVLGESIQTFSRVQLILLFLSCSKHTYMEIKLGLQALLFSYNPWWPSAPKW